MSTKTKTVRMLCSAEGELSLSAGKVYELPAELADSWIESGAAEVPEAGHEAPIVPTVNAIADHHRNDYQEFNPGGEHGAEDEAETPKPKRSRKPKGSTS